MSVSLTTADDQRFAEIAEKLRAELEPRGFEVHPFLTGWYNASVDEKFKLNHDDDTLAFLVLSTPDMFEHCLIPSLDSESVDFSMDPVDSCIKQQMKEVSATFENDDLEILHDYEVNHNRRPKILVQTAGHVSGAAYYYRRSDVQNPPWNERKKIFGVSVHPKYGGWFALRCVVVFENVRYPNLRQRAPPDAVQGDEKRIELLVNFNDHWQDWKYRDIIPVTKKYSERQKEYFATLPKERKELLAKWKVEDIKVCDGY